MHQGNVLKNIDTAVIIPAYNEGKVVAQVVNDVTRHYINVICVDDGSTDNTYQLLKKSRAFVLRHSINRGQGAAIQTGLDFALMLKGVRYFVTFDADGQHSVEDINKLKQALHEKRVNVILGSRFLNSNPQNIPFAKKIILKLAIIFSNCTSGLKLTDTHNGLRAFDKQFARALQIRQDDMSHASEILEVIGQGNFQYAELPVQIHYSDYSKSKGQSLLNAVNIGLDTLMRRFTR